MIVIAPLALVLLAATTTPPTPPVETLKSAEDALAMLDGRDFVGSYVLTVKTDVEAPGEDEHSLEVQEVTIEPDGAKQTRLIKAVEDGRDVTAERRAAGEGEEREQARHGEHRVDLAGLPFGDDLSHVRFTKVRRKDGLLIARFESATKRQAKEDDGEPFDSGEIAWEPESGDPVWIELGSEHPPRFVSELSLRFEYARTDGVLHASRIVTRTKAGVPVLFRIRVNVELAVSDVRRGSGESAAVR